MQAKSSQGAFKRAGKRFLPTKRLLDGTTHKFNRDIQAYTLQASWCQFNRSESSVLGFVRFRTFWSVRRNFLGSRIVLWNPRLLSLLAFRTSLAPLSLGWSSLQRSWRRSAKTWWRQLIIHDYTTTKTDYIQMFWTNCKVAETVLLNETRSA